MNRDIMRRNIEQFLKENTCRSASEASLEVLVKEAFSEYPKELLNEVLNKEEDLSGRKDTVILSDPSKDEKYYIIVQLPEDLFQGIPREAIPDYLVGLVKENRRKG